MQKEMLCQSFKLLFLTIQSTYVDFLSLLLSLFLNRLPKTL